MSIPKPFNSVYGKVILPPDELRCRIAYATDETRSGWKFSCGDGDKALSSPYKTHRTLREHIRRKDGHAPHDNWGDSIGIASSAEVATAARLPETLYIIARDEGDNIISRTGIAAPGLIPAPGPAPQASAAPVTSAAQSEPQPRPRFFPAQPERRPGLLPRTRPLYDDNDYPEVPREVRRLEHEPVGTYLLRGNYLYLETKNTLGDPTFRLHGIYERIDG